MRNDSRATLPVQGNRYPERFQSLNWAYRLTQTPTRASVGQHGGQGHPTSATIWLFPSRSVTFSSFHDDAACAASLGRAAFRSLLGIAGGVEAPTYTDLYCGEWTGVSALPDTHGLNHVRRLGRVYRTSPIYS